MQQEGFDKGSLLGLDADMHPAMILWREGVEPVDELGDVLGGMEDFELFNAVALVVHQTYLVEPISPIDADGEDAGFRHERTSRERMGQPQHTSSLYWHSKCNSPRDVSCGQLYRGA